MIKRNFLKDLKFINEKISALMSNFTYEFMQGICSEKKKENQVYFCFRL